MQSRSNKGYVPETLVLGLACRRARMHCHQFLYHRLCIAEPTRELFAAAELLNQRQTECSEFFPLINVRYGVHQWTEDDLRVILEKIYLQLKQRLYTIHLQHGTAWDAINIMPKNIPIKQHLCTNSDIMQTANKASIFISQASRILGCKM